MAVAAVGKDDDDGPVEVVILSVAAAAVVAAFVPVAELPDYTETLIVDCDSLAAAAVPAGVAAAVVCYPRPRTSHRHQPTA